MLFVRHLKSSFIQKDLEILKKHFDVKVVDFKYGIKDLKSTFQTASKMISGILWADLTFSWFADYHAYTAVKLSKIFRKKSIVIVGGYEVANLPDINYGLLINPISANRVKYIMDYADGILTDDNGLKINAMDNLEIDGENIQTVPGGFDYKLLKPNGEKENLVFTVCLGDTWDRIQLKGVNVFVEASKFIPNAKFLVNGVTGDALIKLKKIAPENVEFTGPVSISELVSLYQKSKVYCQLSMREGHPNALCEAMLCECIPIGTEVQGIKTAIGDTGFYTNYGDVKSVSEAIKKALKSNKGSEARKRIKNQFSENVREEKIIEIIKNL